MRKTIITETRQLPSTAQNLIKVGNNWKFNCPICEKPLEISSSLLIIQDDHDPQWLGNCPHCNALIDVWQPD